MLNKTLLLCLTVSITIIFTGCNSTPHVSLSAYRLENPEVASTPLKVNIAGGLVSDTRLTVQATAEENFDGYDFNFMTNIGMTLAKNLQFSVTGFADSYRFSGKYQFFGDNADLATEGNFSQAITLGYSPRDEVGTELSPKSEVLDDRTRFAWEYKNQTVDIAWILGYRMTHNFMVYGGPFYSYSALKGSRFIGNPEFEKELNLSGRMTGANLALEYRFDMGLALSLEALTYNNRWEGGEYSFSDATLNFKIDYQF